MDRKYKRYKVITKASNKDKYIVGYCKDCGKTLFSEDVVVGCFEFYECSNCGLWNNSNDFK